MSSVLWLNIVQVLLLGGLAFGAIVAGFRRTNSEAQQQAINAQSAELIAQKDTITSLKTEIVEARADCNQRLAESNTKIDKLQSANKLLQEFSTGIPDWTKIHSGIAAILSLAEYWNSEDVKKHQQEHYRQMDEVIGLLKHDS